MAFALFEDFVGAALVLVFQVEDGIDEMLAFQDAEPIFPAEARKYSGIAKSGLAIQVELGGPPGCGTILELHPIGVEVVAAALGAEGGEIFDFEVPRLLEKMVVGHEVGVFLGRSGARKKNEKGGEHE